MLLMICLASIVHSQSHHIIKVKDTGSILLADAANQTYLIRTKKNKIYLPTTLTKDFMKNGLKVIFVGNVDTARLKRARLAGIPIYIYKIKRQ